MKDGKKQVEDMLTATRTVDFFIEKAIEKMKETKQNEVIGCNNGFEFHIVKIKDDEVKIPDAH